MQRRFCRDFPGCRDFELRHYAIAATLPLRELMPPERPLFRCDERAGYAEMFSPIAL